MLARTWSQIRVPLGWTLPTGAAASANAAKTGWAIASGKGRSGFGFEQDSCPHSHRLPLAEKDICPKTENRGGLRARPDVAPCLRSHATSGCCPNVRCACWAPCAATKEKSSTRTIETSESSAAVCAYGTDSLASTEACFVWCQRSHGASPSSC